MKILKLLIIFFIFFSSLTSKASQQEILDDSYLIPLEDLFDIPDYYTVRISSNGEFIAYRAPYKGIQNIWLVRRDNLSNPQPITDSKTNITSLIWSLTNKHIFISIDNNGDENWHINVLDIHTKAIRDLTPFKGVKANIIAQSEKRRPEEIVISMNKRRKDYFDLYILNILTGELTLLEENNEFLSIAVDENYVPKWATKSNPDGSYTVYTKSEGKWIPFLEIPTEEVGLTGIMGGDKAGKTLYLIDSSKSNTGQLVSVDVETGKKQIKGHDPKADVNGIFFNVNTGEAIGYSVNYDKEKYFPLTEDFKKDLDYLQSIEEGSTIKIASNTVDDKYWIVAFIKDIGSPKYYLYDREKRQAKFLFYARKKLEKLPLCPMKPVVIKSRDGFDLVSYLTLPCKNKNFKKPKPLVLLVHGGPKSRDIWGYNMTHQWLANRGYAVLSLNYRGSTGFGKKFLNAGNGEWGGKMQDDLTDAVQWAIDQGIADKDKIAIMGTSYGGYAALAGIAFTPDLYACGIDVCGRSNLVTKFTEIPEYWKPNLSRRQILLGANPSTVEGKRLLEQRSPLFHADKIKKPLFIAHGANDPRVKKAESDRIASILKNKEIPLVYVVYPEEGHGLRKPENTLTLYAMIEAFLAKYLGGKYLPLEETDLVKKSKYIIEEGEGIVSAL